MAPAQAGTSKSLRSDLPSIADGPPITVIAAMRARQPCAHRGVRTHQFGDCARRVRAAQMTDRIGFAAAAALWAINQRAQLTSLEMEIRMSHRTAALRSARSAALKAGGSTLTCRARVATAEKFIEFLYANNIQVPDVKNVRVRHVVAFVDDRRTVCKTRRLTNIMSHIRQILRAADRPEMATNALLTNKALGIAGASRRGTNHSVSESADRCILDAAAKADDYIFAAVRLQRELGLRAQEAVMSGPSLARWEAELLRGDPVYIVAGTKTGRPRYTRPVDGETTLAAVRYASSVLVRGKRENLFPHATLKKAVRRYQNVWYTRLSPASEERHTSHSYRYAYAQDRMLQCLRPGMSKRDALATVAMDLGHGDGRGRYIRQVYGQTIAMLTPRGGSRNPVEACGDLQQIIAPSNAGLRVHQPPVP